MYHSNLNEDLHYKDMEGMMKPTIHVDEFSAKMGDDEDIIVASFFVRSELAAKDLISWLEKGYDWVLDADRSPGEIRPNRYLVYLEMRRRSSAGELLNGLLGDLGTLTEFDSPEDWTLHYENQVRPWSVDTFNSLVPLSPQKYREKKEKNLNEMRAAAGIETKQVFDKTREIKKLQSAAGI